MLRLLFIAICRISRVHAGYFPLPEGTAFRCSLVLGGRNGTGAVLLLMPSPRGGRTRYGSLRTGRQGHIRHGREIRPDRNAYLRTFVLQHIFLSAHPLQPGAHGIDPSLWGRMGAGDAAVLPYRKSGTFHRIVRPFFHDRRVGTGASRAPMHGDRPLFRPYIPVQCDTSNPGGRRNFDYQAVKCTNPGHIPSAALRPLFSLHPRLRLSAARGTDGFRPSS